MSDQKIKVGMIGVGGFGNYRRDRMRETGLFRLAACYDRDAQVLQKACAQDNAKACASVEEVLATPGLEGLVISTGIDSHVPLAVAAMRAGLHVFVEKPLCGRPDEIDVILQARQETGKIVGVGHTHSATNPVVMLVQQFINSGQLGTIVAYEENSSHSGGLEIKPGDWRGIREKNPGGMLLQCGVHALHDLIFLFGDIQSVSCVMRYDANPNTQTADAANVLLRHNSGLLGTLNCYHVTAYFHELRVFGTKGNLYIDTHHKTATFQERKRNEVEVRVPVPMPAHDEVQHRCMNLISWYNAIRKGTPVNPSLEHGIATVLPVFAAEQSDLTGNTIKLAQMQTSRH